MKYSNETIAKVMASYLPFTALYVDKNIEVEINGMHLAGDVYGFLLYGADMWEYANEFKPLLRPLAFITEEHWHELIGIGLPVVAGDLKAFVYWLGYGNNINKLYWKSYQYLQQQGYSLPHILLDGLDPITAGIAIEKI